MSTVEEERYLVLNVHGTTEQQNGVGRSDGSISKKYLRCLNLEALTLDKKKLEH